MATAVQCWTEPQRARLYKWNSIPQLGLGRKIKHCRYQYHIPVEFRNRGALPPCVIYCTTLHFFLRQSAQVNNS